MRVLLFLGLLAPALFAGPTGPVTDARKNRRARLSAWLDDGYALLIGQTFTDVLQPPQDGSFLYLTGVEDAGAFLLLAGPKAAPFRLKTANGEQEAREILLLRTGPPAFLQFYGVRNPPTDETARRLGVSHVRPAPGNARQLLSTLRKYLPKNAKLHVPRYSGADDATIYKLRRTALELLAEEMPGVWVDPVPGPARGAKRPAGRRSSGIDRRLSSMRSIKDKIEIAALQHAIDVTLEAFSEALPAIRPGSSEAAVDAALLFAVRRRGCWPAYRFVVASGPNSVVPHYFRNESPLRKNELLVIDAGAESDRYAADITRTFPVAGRFTKRQREVYEAVLQAQQAALQLVRPGATFSDLQLAARKVLIEKGLSRHALHGISHHVGLKVHDPGSHTLEEGMTITVEPGVYILQENLGVRIEDIVLVTKDGGKVLSADFPKTADAVEKWMAKKR